MQNIVKNSKKFKKIPFMFSIILLIFSCLVFFFLYNKVEENKRISEEIQTKWETEALRREEIRSLERSIKDIETERNLLESHFAYGSDVVPFLNTIEQLAIKANATSQIVSVEIPQKTNVLSVAVKASGSFESIYKFLTLLENSPYELEFTSANIQNVNAAGAVGVSNASSVPVKSTASFWEVVFKIQLLSFIQ